MIFALIWAGWWSYRAYAYLESGQLHQAVTAANRAHFITNTLNAGTGSRLADLVVWHHSLSLIQELAQVESAGSQVTQTLDKGQAISLKPLIEITSNTSFHLNQINSHLPSSFVVKSLIPAQEKTRLQNLDQQLDQLSSLLQGLMTGSHTWLVMLQNPDEIRATGGFLGSYALVKINNGQITEVVFEDVYDADGQFDGYLEPPHGVNLYLSSNRGLRLPDANWHLHFPKSAQNVLAFFALGKRGEVAGLNTVNATVIADLVDLVGSLWLPDYQIYLDSDNMTKLLSQHRDDFFPGSIQKKQALGRVFTQLQLKAAGLEANDWSQILSLVMRAIEQKDLMFYSPHPKWQEFFEQNQVAGHLDPDYQPFLALVESNVGINKANQKVERSVEIEVTDYRLSVNVRFTNQNLPPTLPAQTTDQPNTIGQPSPQADHLAYVNYQRLLMPTNWQVHRLVFDGREIDDWHRSQIELANRQLASEVGFLVVVPEQTTKTLNLELELDKTWEPRWQSINNAQNDKQNGANTNQLIIFKQPGLPPTPYTITSDWGQESFILDKDFIFTWF